MSPETATAKDTKEIVAVIDIGSSAIRMVVAEIGAKLSIRPLETLQKSVRFGKDVFTNGRLSPAAIRDGIEILSNYRTILDSYGVKKIHAIATSAIREAANRDNFIDQVFVRTGIDVEVLEGAEENRLELIAVEEALKDKLDFNQKNCLIMEVGTGSTEVIVTSKGQVALTRTLPVGPIRLPDQAVAGKTDAASLQRILKRHIHMVAAEFSREFPLENIDTFIALGAHVRFVSKQLSDKRDPHVDMLPAKDLQEFTKSLAKMTVEQIADQYGLTYTDAETVYPSLLIYTNFLSEIRAEQVVVPMVSIRDALLLEVGQLVSGYKRTDLSRQIINSSKNLGKKYHYDETHALAVAHICTKLFDLLKDDHGLGPRERMLLEVSGLLHDIGMFISPASHHKHSSYLVNAAEIFGLRKAEKDIVSNVVRYHRRSAPKPTHVPYMSLPRTDRAIVSKLAAILRVAEALEKSHQQRMRDFTLTKNGSAYTLWVPEALEDISIEREALAKKTDMFVDVLGATLALKQGTAPKN